MKYTFIFLLLFISSTIFAQTTKEDIYGAWVKVKLTYNNGAELPDDNALKYSYVRYTFKSPDIFNPSVAYNEKGGSNTFDVDGDIIKIQLPGGFVINQFKIKSVKDTLILVQQGTDQGFDDPSTLKFYFIPERVYQNNIRFKPADIYSVTAGDTIYKDSPKVYATYKDGSFRSAIYNGLNGNMDGRSGHFIATFTVFKSGIADSLKITKGIDDKFNKRFIKVFNQTKKNWEPAVLNGKIVPVEVTIELRYETSAEALPAQNFTFNGNDAYNKQEYDVALAFYNQALDNVADDKANLYKRGICKLHLGNTSGACEDWNKIKALGGSPEADAMLEKYCK